MKTALILSSLLAFTASVIAQDPVPPAKAPAPQDATAKGAKTLQLGQRLLGTTTLKDLDGKDYVARKHQGKITVVNFYSIECPIQKGWDARLAAIQKEYGGKGVVFLSIAANAGEIDDGTPKSADAKPYDKIRKHLEAQKLPYTVLVDAGNVVADLFGAETTPDIFVFSEEGKLVYRGLIDDDKKGDKGDKAKQHLKPVLDKLIAKEKFDPYQTKPEGCNIKRVAKAKEADAPRDGGK